jgi:hypothetical protein
VTQKMLAAALVREPLPAVARVRRSPANAKPKKKRRSPAERDGTQAA